MAIFDTLSEADTSLIRGGSNSGSRIAMEVIYVGARLEHLNNIIDWCI